MAAKEKKKQCFVVGPIGDDDSEDRIHADWLLEEIIQPVFDEHFADFEVTRADKLSNPGQITTQVITALLEAELVIADLTTLNPNAFYEIGIRHTIQKPIIHMHLEGQRIPFDIAAFRSMKFARRRPADLKSARATLLQFVREALNPEHQIDNPVTFSRGKVEFEQKATPAEKLVQDQLDELSGRILLIERNRGSQKPALNSWPEPDWDGTSPVYFMVKDPQNRGGPWLSNVISYRMSPTLEKVSISPFDQDGMQCALITVHDPELKSADLVDMMEMLEAEGLNVSLAKSGPLKKRGLR